MKTKVRRLDLKEVDYSPHVQLRIRPKGIFFEADCQIGMYPFRFDIQLKEGDMSLICQDLQARLEDLKDAYQTGTVNTQQTALRELAETGYSALRKIFAPAEN